MGAAGSPLKKKKDSRMANSNTERQAMADKRRMTELAREASNTIIVPGQDWHQTQAHRDDLLSVLERVCKLNLRHNGGDSSELMRIDVEEIPTGRGGEGCLKRIDVRHWLGWRRQLLRYWVRSASKKNATTKGKERQAK